MVFCSKCGSENADGSAYCSKCGAAIGAAGTGPTPAAEPAPVSPKSGGNDGAKLKRLAVVAVAIVVVAVVALAVGLNTGGGEDDGNYDPVSGSWSYTATPVVDNMETTFWNATLEITIEDNVITGYEESVTKTLIADMDQDSVDLTFNQIHAGGTGSSLQSPPAVLPGYRSESEIIQDSYTYLEGYKDLNLYQGFKTGAVSVTTHLFESPDGDLTLYVGSDGVIYKVVDRSGEVNLYYVLDGWEGF